MKTYKGQEVANAEDMPAGIYALIDVSSPHGADYWVLSSDYGRKNLSREVCQRGWLGTTNNVSQTAHGCVELYRDSSGRMRIRPVADDALVERMDEAAHV